MTFTDLITRLEKGSGEDRELLAAIIKALGVAYPHGYAPLTSLDAAIALVERVRPDASHICVTKWGGKWMGWVANQRTPHGPAHKSRSSEGSSSGAARALCAALLKSLEAK